MKHLILLRHSKASPQETGIRDYDRPLTERGKRDACRAGEILNERGLRPDFVLTSSARRARKTAKRTVRGLGFDIPREQVDSLYLAPPAEFVREIRSLDDQLMTVLIVAHNPGLEELLRLLTGDHSPLPTTGMACLEVPVDSWSVFDLGTKCQLSWHWSPNEEE